MNRNQERFYEMAAQEVATKEVVRGLMAQAYAEADGDEKKAVARYIRLRVPQLESEYEQRRLQSSRKARIERDRYLQRQSLPYKVGRFYAKHPIVSWCIIITLAYAVYALTK